MKKILTIGASSSKNSINKTLATFTASQVKNCEEIEIDLNKFEMPIYSQDREEENGIPELAIEFVKTIEAADGIIISLAEHNGSYTAAFKNILDWATRHKKELWSNKPMLLLSTSPGARGAMTVLENAKLAFPYFGGNIVNSFSLPSYYDNFSQEDGIVNEDLKSKLDIAVFKFENALDSI